MSYPEGGLNSKYTQGRQVKGRSEGHDYYIAIVLDSSEIFFGVVLCFLFYTFFYSSDKSVYH